jgi:hypothetical protein
MGIGKAGTASTVGRMAACLITLATGFSWTLAIAADDDGIATDRPDFVESSSVVGKGVVQIETSLAHERDKRDGVKTTLRSTPTLLRYGIVQDFELRLESDGLLSQNVSGPAISARDRGTADMSLGVKWHFADGNETQGRPALALLAHLDIDSGSAAFRGPGKVPSVRITSEWELADDASFGVMPGLAYAKDDGTGKRYWSGILAATYSRPLTGPVRGFVEIAGQELRSKRYGGNVVTFDTGITWALDRDTQLDLSINLGLNKNTPDRAMALGFSRRLR